MAYSNYNPNPSGRAVCDCVIRAVAKATDVDWETAYVSLCAAGLAARDLPNADHVWGGHLKRSGFRRVHLGDDVPDGYTVSDFAAGHPWGTFVLSTHGHVVTVRDGQYYDSFDSGNELVNYYYERTDK